MWRCTRLRLRAARIVAPCPSSPLSRLAPSSSSLLRRGVQSWRPGKRADDEDEEDDEAVEAAKFAAHERARQQLVEEHNREVRERMEAEERQRREQQDAEHKKTREEAAAEAERKKKVAEEEQARAQQQQQQKQQQQQQQGKQRTGSSEEDIPMFERLGLHLHSNRARRGAASAEPEPDSSSADAPTAASSAGQSLPDLKTQLRRFFLQIHPDLFESHPQEKSHNARSLAELTDFIDSLKKPDSSSRMGVGGGERGKMARVEFFVRARNKESDSTTSDVQQQQFYKISSTLTLSARDTPASRRALYAALSSLFKQAGLRHANSWNWGDEFETSSTSGAGAGAGAEAERADRAAASFRAGSAEEEWFARFASRFGAGNLGMDDATSVPVGGGGEMESFVREVRAHAAYLESSSRPRRHALLLQAANLRLQGVSVIYDSSREWSAEEQKGLLDAFERSMRRCAHFAAPRGMRLAAEDLRSPDLSPDAGVGTSIPFGAAVRVGEGVQGIWAQMKQQQMKEAGSGGGIHDATAAAAAAGPQERQAGPQPQSPPTHRSPFSLVPSYFSLSSPHCLVDGRGRLVFSLRQSESDWVRFLDSDPELLHRASKVAENHRALKRWEREVAAVAGVYDLWAEESMVGSWTPSPSSLSPPPPSLVHASYVSFLDRLQRESHVVSGVGSRFPSLREISLRVSMNPLGLSDPSALLEGPAPVSSFGVDPALGTLLVPVRASPAEVRDAIMQRGQECVQIKQRQMEEMEEHTAALLHAKRHLRLRSLTAAPGLSRDQMRDAAERLSRVFGGLRELLEHSSLVIGDEYRCDEADGTIHLPWNWS